MSSKLLGNIAALPNLFLAWKKTRTYIRRHNWYHDPLQLELFELDLEQRLRVISAAILDGTYAPSDARLIPAPKRIERPEGGKDGRPQEFYRDRPLADCSLEDQTVWAAIVNCVADRFEDRFIASDPADLGNVSYGNRLYRVPVNGDHTFSVENNKLYRQYYKDYSNFLKRTLQAAEEQRLKKAIEVWGLDIKSFYDCICIDKLLGLISEEVTERDALGLVERMLRCWTLLDLSGENRRSSGRGIPQGLAASGFLANIYLTPFDRFIVEGCNARVLHYARYVDDMRVVLWRRGRPTDDPRPITEMAEFLDSELGLELSPAKKERLWPTEEDTGPIREDQLAVRVSQVDWDVSHATSPADARRIAAELETLLYLDFENVAMRRDSRLRFSVNRLVWLCTSFGEVDADYWEELTERLREWLLSQWQSDKSQRALLLHYLSLTPDGKLSRAVISVLKMINETKEQDEEGPKSTWAWYLKTALYNCLYDRSTREDADLKLSARVQKAVEADWRLDRPWYLRKAAYALASLFPRNARSKQAKTLRSAIDQPGMVDPLIRPSVLSCLYSWCGRESQRALLLRPEAGIEDLWVFLRSVGVSPATDRSVGRTVAEFALCHPDATAQVGHILPMLALQPGDLIHLAQKGMAAARALSTQMWHNWAKPSDRAQLGKLKAYQLYREQLKEGYVSLAQAFEQEAFRQELLVIKLGERLSKEVTSGRLERTKVGTGGVHPGNIFLKMSSGANPEIEDIRIVPLAQDERFVDPTALGEGKPTKALDKCWWRTGTALSVLAAAKGDCRFSSDFSLKTKFAQWLNPNVFRREGVQLSTYTEATLRAMSGWLGRRSSVSAGEIHRRFSDARTRLELLQVTAEESPRRVIQITPVVLEGTDSRSPRIALGQVRVSPQQIMRGNLDSDGELALRRQVMRTVHRAVERGLEMRGSTWQGYWDDPPVDLLVMPELCVPRSCIPYLQKAALSFRMCIIAGLEYAVEGNHWQNELLLLVPFELDQNAGLRGLLELYQPKLFPAPGEVANASKHGAVITQGHQQFMIEDGGVAAWTALDCYDFTSIELRSVLRGMTDIFIVSSLNQDLTTFDHLCEASIRDLHSYVVLANSGHYGGSQVLAPFHSEHERTVFKVQGSDLELTEVRELDVAALRSFQANPDPSQNRFKSLPAGYRMSEWRRRRTP